MTRLIQETLTEPWQHFVATVLLNRTKGAVVKPILRRLLDAYPTAELMAGADPALVAEMIRPVGFQNRKAKTLIALSKKFESWDGDPASLPGVGRYATDSYKIFFTDESVEPEDDKLCSYLKARTVRANRP